MKKIIIVALLVMFAFSVYAANEKEVKVKVTPGLNLPDVKCTVNGVEIAIGELTTITTSETELAIKCTGSKDGIQYFGEDKVMSSLNYVNRHIIMKKFNTKFTTVAAKKSSTSTSSAQLTAVQKKKTTYKSTTATSTSAMLSDDTSTETKKSGWICKTEDTSVYIYPTDYRENDGTYCPNGCDDTTGRCKSKSSNLKKTAFTYYITTKKLDENFWATG